MGCEIIEFYLRIPQNPLFLDQRNPRAFRAPFLRGIFFLTLRDDEKGNKGLFMFPVLNIAIGYADYYFQLLIVFCTIFDPLTQVKGEISYEGVLRAQSFH